MEYYCSMSYSPEDILATGATLREWRRVARLQQADLGALIGVDQTTVSLLELGKRRPSISIIGAWARACGQDASTVAPRLAQMAGFDAEEIRRLTERLRWPPACAEGAYAPDACADGAA